jgi:hypothetical protein
VELFGSPNRIRIDILLVNCQRLQSLWLSPVRESAEKLGARVPPGRNARPCALLFLTFSPSIYRVSPHRPSHATIACPNCGIYQAVEVDCDGGQRYASLPVTPCSVCCQDLCCFCDQAQWECGQTVCLHCTVTVPDGTPSGLRLCQPCAISAAGVVSAGTSPLRAPSMNRYTLNELPHPQVDFT